jgi:hypothetical protein
MGDDSSKVTSACPECAKLRARVVELEAQVAELTALVSELLKRLNRNSSNSSKPPSSDPPWNKQPAKEPPTGRKPGGQPGHEGHQRVRLPPERVKEILHHWPEKCEHCHAPLPKKSGPKDPPPSWHQVADLPPQLVEVTEHLGHACTCPRCGMITRQEIPAAIRAHTIGPSLAAALCYLSGRARCSKRVVQEIAETLFGVPISLGTVCSQERKMSAALEAPYQEALEAVRAAPVKYVSFLMGIWFLANAVANKLGGQLAGQIEHIERGELHLFWYRWFKLGGQADFFLVFVVGAVGAGLLVLALTPLLKRLLGGRE